MGRKHSVVSFLCGVLFRKKPPAVEDADEFEDAVDSPTSTSGGSGSAHSPEEASSAATKPSSPDDHRHQNYSLPMPPGTGTGTGSHPQRLSHHMRTASCGHNLQHRRSNSGVSKLVSSMSLRVMGGGGAAAASAADRLRLKERKYFRHEDSVWKKTIILGERCRVPEEDDDDDLNLFDEKGNKFITYHPKSHSGLLQFSRQNPSFNSAELPRKL